MLYVEPLCETVLDAVQVQLQIEGMILGAAERLPVIGQNLGHRKRAALEKGSTS